MRIIGGKAKGRTLRTVPGTTTRPILDRVKTALFDTLRPQLEGIEMLDLFAGSGAVGIEALSQGASRCTFLDLEPAAIRTIRQNLEIAGLSTLSEVRHADAFLYLRNTSRVFDLIYIAPPQYEGMWIEAMQLLAERPHLVNPTGLLVVQIDPKEYEKLELTSFEELRSKRYGNTLLLFYCYKPRETAHS